MYIWAKTVSLCAFLSLILSPVLARAQDAYSSNWFNRVDRTQAEQPHWITPIATTTPRLEEEFRYDIFWQTNPEGVTTENYGGSKGLELIPAEKVEVILSPPPYIVHNNPTIRDGFGDFSLLGKYRLLSSNEEHGNYILTAFLGMTLPTGSHTNGARHAIITPTIAYGKGFSHFAAQGTFAIGLPTGDTNLLGRSYTWNNAFQYHVFRKLWPGSRTQFNVLSTRQERWKEAEFCNSGPGSREIPPGQKSRLDCWRRLPDRNHPISPHQSQRDFVDPVSVLRKFSVLPDQARVSDHTRCNS